MSDLPDIRARGLGARGTLARDWVDGRPEARALLPRPWTGRLEGPAGSARLPAPAVQASTTGAREKLERILAGEGRLVTTGQQPVLFGGPLYVLYKALTAIEAARALEASTGAPALACFWIASDDHDWEEVAGTRLLDLGNEPRSLRVEPPEGWEGRPVGPAPLPESTGEAVESLSEMLPQSDFASSYLTSIRDEYRAGRSFARAFSGTLAGWLGDRPWAWIDAVDPRLKRASVPLLERALREPVAVEEGLRGGATRVREAGYEPAIPVLEGATPVFFDTGSGRERLYRDGERVAAGREGERRDLEEWSERLREEPERFSPNVALRPVLESWLLPAGVTVLGPGELAYWAQLPPLFEWAGVAAPEVTPRASWTLVESKVAKVLGKLGEEPEALEDGGEALIERETRRARPPEVSEALSALRSATGVALEDVEEAVGDALPGIRSAVGKARGQLFGAIDELERQVDARVRERQEILVRQIRKAAAHLFPDGRPQERVMNPLYYLTRYGPALLEALEERTRVAVRSWAE